MCCVELRETKHDFTGADCKIEVPYIASLLVADRSVSKPSPELMLQSRFIHCLAPCSY